MSHNGEGSSMSSADCAPGQNTAVVLLSGGQDSTTCLFWARQEFGDVIAVSFDYHQKHRRELECAGVICSRFGICHHVIDLRVLRQLMKERAMHHATAGGREGGQASRTFIDGRNLFFLSVSALFAKQRDMRHIVAGFSQEDFADYPDCRDVFVKAANVALDLGMDYQFVIHTPLIRMGKKETWELAHRLGVLDIIVHETVTCYEGIVGDGCGVCPACRLRTKGYREFTASRSSS